MIQLGQALRALRKASRRRVHPALLWGGGASLLMPILIAAADTRVGLAFADLFR